MEYREVLVFLFTALFAYLAGSVPFGLLIGKFHGVDIRKEGSGNIGATNVTRVVGKWWGKLCFLCDFLKGAFAVGMTLFLLKKGVIADFHGLLAPLAALAAVAGHIFPVWLKLKGGKGISTAAGAIFALNPPAVGCALLLWGIVFFFSRYVSVASMAAALSLPVFAFGFRFFWTSTGPELVLYILLAVLAVLKHTSNIRRLLNGTESKFVKNK